MYKVTNGIATESVAQWTDNTPPLKVAPIYDNVDVSIVTSERKILINVDEEVRNIEGSTLIFNVSGVKDVNDNMMNPVTWTAYVNKNQLKWAKSSVDIRKPSGLEEQFSVKILNTSSNVEYWTIQNLPSWLEADVQSGELAPLSTDVINFTVSEATAIGKYEATLYLSGNNDIPEPLVLNLVCEGDVPDWPLNPDDFSSSMNMVAQLKINGYVSDDSDDIVAAFINDKCVGKANPVYNQRYDTYYLIMNIYGNSGDGNGTESDENKEVLFKAYDASAGTLYPIVKASDAIVFRSDDIIGDLADPVILSSVDEIQQSIQLNKGWSWISMNVEPDDNSVENVLKSVAENVLYVKSKSNFAEIDANGMYHGTLQTMEHSKMYKVKSDEATMLNIAGKSISTGDNPITIYNGWNWIGYNPAVIMSPADALADMNPLDGDVIKNRDEFAVYDGYEWVGTLASMQPGCGYIYKSNDEEKTFVYPSIVQSNRSYVDDKQDEVASETEYDYSGNMNVIAYVKDGDDIVENAKIEVFADNVLRGVSNQSVIDNKHFLTIHGDSSNDVLSFKVTIDGDVYEISNVMSFNDDAVVGTLDNPYILQINPDIVVTVYPTLVKDIVNISCKDNIKTVTIHNVSGLKVYYDENLGDLTQINVEGLVAGVYIVTVVTESGDVKVVHIVKG